MSAELHARLVARRGDFTLDVELRVAEGVTVLFGPSGAGKTSVLRALAGLLPLDHGFVRLGDDWTLLPPERRAVGSLFQSHALFPHLTVEENVAFGAREPGAARRWLERLELTRLAGRAPSSLSGGEAQRVALARALARGPRLLLLDEPFSSLDEARRDELLTMLKALIAAERLVTLLVTHDREEGERLGGRFLALEGGRLR